MKYYLLRDNYTVVATTETLDGEFLLTEGEYRQIVSGASPPYYFDGTKWMIRPIFTHPSPISIKEGQKYTLQLPNDYQKLLINKVLTDNVFVLFEKPGTYEIEIEPFPYMPAKIIFIVEPDLNKEKERKIEQLEKGCNSYILRHYPLSRQNTFKAKYIRIVEELTLNAFNYTNEQIDALNTVRARIREAINWIDLVLDYFYARLAEIKSAVDIATVQSISWDFSQFDALDPKVTIEEIRNLLSKTGLVI